MPLMHVKIFILCFFTKLVCSFKIEIIFILPTRSIYFSIFSPTSLSSSFSLPLSIQFCRSLLTITGISSHSIFTYLRHPSELKRTDIAKFSCRLSLIKFMEISSSTNSHTQRQARESKSEREREREWEKTLKTLA